MTSELKGGGSSELSQDINVITAEINTYQRIAGEAIFEIGRRLKHVKENDLVHGEWSKWCRNEIKMSTMQANKFVKVFEELSDGANIKSTLGIEALYQIATMPAEARTETHTLADGTTKTPDEMTVRELREVKRALKDAEKEKEEAERIAKQAEQNAEQAQEQAELSQRSEENMRRQLEDSRSQFEVSQSRHK